MKKQILLFILLGLFVISFGVQADVFRWLNKDGEVIYGDSPPKEVQSEIVPLEEAGQSGMRFATDQQIEQINESSNSAAERSRSTKTKKIDSHCRKYISQLNKTEIYLEHTYNERDAQKARDLRKLIKRECAKDVLSYQHDDSRCEGYRQDLSKVEVYLEHTPTVRDKQKAKDLHEQIKRECH
ncbi:MAG: DUF4124 domain-containing protein [Gammaproteobacteria bacterium]|nr:DUF4124 domain-containing protein [Gammaproteobacteria bacterium]